MVGFRVAHRGSWLLDTVTNRCRYAWCLDGVAKTGYRPCRRNHEALRWIADSWRYKSNGLTPEISPRAVSCAKSEWSNVDVDEGLSWIRKRVRLQFATCVNETPLVSMIGSDRLVASMEERRISKPLSISSHR